MYHEKQSIFGNWDSGIALDYHYTAYAGEKRKGTRLKEMLDAAKQDVSSFMKLIDVVSDHLSPGRIFPSLFTYDVIVPVPPRNSAGSSPDGDLVFELARQVGIRRNMLLFRGLRAARNVPSLRGVDDPAERAALRRDLYVVDDGDILRGKKVLVIDDVYYTGATLNEVVKTLRQHSTPEKVSVLTLTTGGGVKRHTTLEQEAAEEMASIYEEYSVNDYDGEAYLGDGMRVSSDRRILDR